MMVWLIPDDKAFNKIVAKEVAHCEELYAAAEAVETTAIGLASVHKKTGNYIASMRITKPNKVDYAVSVEDKAAAHIEWGHRVDLTPKPGRKTHSERNKMDFSGKSELRRGERWVPGLHIMRNAAIAHGGKVG